MHNATVNHLVLDTVAVFTYLLPSFVGNASFYLSPSCLFPLQGNVCAISLNKNIGDYLTCTFRDGASLKNLLYLTFLCLKTRIANFTYKAVDRGVRDTLRKYCS